MFFGENTLNSETIVKHTQKCCWMEDLISIKWTIEMKSDYHINLGVIENIIITNQPNNQSNNQPN